MLTRVARMAHMLTRWLAYYTHSAKVSGKIVETLFSNMVTSGNPCAIHSKLKCLLCSIRSSNSCTTLHGGDGGGKAIFPPFEVSEMKKAQFWVKCLNSFCCRLRLWV